MTRSVPLLAGAVIAALLVPAPVAEARAPAAGTKAATVAPLAAAGAVLAAPPAPPVALTGARWIWYPEGEPAVSAPAATRYLRKTVTVAAADIPDAQFVVTGDDTVDVWVNGTQLAGSPRVGGSWGTALYVDIAGSLKPGANTIAVAARNSGGPAGVIGRLRAGTVDVVTDTSWSAAQTVTEDWTTGSGGWAAAKDLGVYGSAPWGASVGSPSTGGTSPVTLTHLTVNRQTNPVGVGKVAFSWRLAAGVAGQMQGRYQIAVGTTPGANNVWDSGVVASTRSLDIPYAGPALTNNKTYHWRVRVWDAQGRASAWSAGARFDTAITWTAGFVGSSPLADLGGTSWIWYPEGAPQWSAPVGTRYFRRTVTLSAPVMMVISADDSFQVWIDGVPSASSPQVPDSWRQALPVPVKAGTSTIAIAATNAAAGPAGLIAKIGPVTTDGAWKASQSAPSGWQQAGFNDAAWPSALVLAPYGGGQWGANVKVTGAAPYLRKGFTITKPVARARLFTTALGVHDSYLNGVRVGKERLAPGWTDYKKRLQYRGYDVTAQVNQGANALGAQIGDGWYSGGLGFAGSQVYGDKPWYSAQLIVEHTDGTSTTVQTDGSWRTAPSHITAEDLYTGEEQDARRAIGGWNEAGFDDAGWPVVTVRSGSLPAIVPAVDPGVTVQKELTPVQITQPVPGTFIADLGQNFGGWTRLKVNGPAGTTVKLRHAEHLNPDGTLYVENLRGAAQTDRFTLAGGGLETFEPRFTVHGFRYVEITGFPGTPTTSSITGLAAWTDGAETGTFVTSDNMINKLHSNIQWTARSNMQSLPIDCPQRDERYGWTGDIASFAATSTFGFDVRGLLDKFMIDVVDAQRPDGAFTNMAPDVLNMPAGIAGWSDAGVIIPYTIWQRYGDLSVADRDFGAMAKYVDYLRSTSGPNLIRNQWTYGDWHNPGAAPGQALVSTAYFAWSARLLSRMAEATGRTAEATKYRNLADDVAAAFANQWIGADGTVDNGGTQTGYVLALAFGLVPQNRVQAAADKLAAKVAANGGHLAVGFLGVENLLPVLADNGHAATAYQILQKQTYPSWGYMINLGATTIWERWDSIQPNGVPKETSFGTTSFNHFDFGAVGDWLYRGVGGVAPAAPGYAKVLFAPKPGGTLTSATSDLTTAYGQTRSSWTRSGSTITLQVIVPQGATATVRVPGTTVTGSPAQAVPMGGTSYAVGAGSYTFTSTL